MSGGHSSLEGRSSSDMDPFSPAQVYYGGLDGETILVKSHHRSRQRTFSTNVFPEAEAFDENGEGMGRGIPVRRGSHDDFTEYYGLPRRFVVKDVEGTLARLQKQEDTDGNAQITIEDKGPKVFLLGTASSNGSKKVAIRGTYMVSNLLQELYLAKEHGRKEIVLDEARLNENPVNRLARLIQGTFWDNLTRRIDGSAIEVAGRDPKDWTDDPRPRIYIPRGAPEQHEYYSQVAKERPELRLDVLWLPEKITPEAVRDMNEKPGLLAVAMEKVKDEKTGEETLRGLPFVVPGGRFNELYGWDSYMESLGLLRDGKVHLAKSMVQNFCFSIEHYGKILNATRSYYLCRSQPPFLTDMALRVYENINSEPDSLEFLRVAILAAMKEYKSVWMAAPRLDKATGLSRYRPEGLGVPPETEASHFEHIVSPYAKKNGMTFKEFVRAYNYGEVKEPELDEYFLHDRAVRESGHDTTYRFERKCANLANIDLNSLLYKYETDISRAISLYFKDKLIVPAEFCVDDEVPNHLETSAIWNRRARKRKEAMNKYLWNEKEGAFFDYNTATKEQETYESATTFWAMWSGVASPEQATAMVNKCLPKLEAIGGLLSGTKDSLSGEIGLDHPNRQWDYPFGWAPQQILAWEGLRRYHYEAEAKRLAYKWLFMITKAFVDFNGVVVEKYNVTRPIDPHRVEAEYGNQGSDFVGVAKEGFGWVNASYVVGLSIIDLHMRRSLGALVPWPNLKSAMDRSIREEQEEAVSE